MKCFFCGNDAHEIKCPLIKAYEYGPDMQVTRIEFVTFTDLRQAEPVLMSLPTHSTRQ